MERYPGEKLNLLQHFPAYAQRTLVLGENTVKLACLLKRKTGGRVEIAERDPLAQRIGAQLLDAVYAVDGARPLSFSPPHTFDAVMLLPSSSQPDSLPGLLDTIDAALAEDGLVFLHLPNRACWKAPEKPGWPGYPEILAAAGEKGLFLYRQWLDMDDAFLGAQADAEGVIHWQGRQLRPANEEERIRLGVVAYLAVLVRAGYRPLEKAQRFARMQQWNWATEELDLIPEHYLERPESAGAVAAEKILTLYHQALQSDQAAAQLLLHRAQKIFNRAMRIAPYCAGLYQTQAEFWRLMGNQAAAWAMLASFQHVCPDAAVARQMQSLTAPATGLPDYEESPLWRPEQGRPRILFIMHPRPHYGLDVLYDGLCRLLGVEQVVDFPYKPYLHGELPEELRNYPCTFSWPGHSWSMEEVLAALEKGAFDFVLYGDCELALMREDSQRLVKAAGGIPFFIVDQLDEFLDAREWVADRIAGARVYGYFKRELLPCMGFGEEVWPLPFSYPEDRLPEIGAEERTDLLFWAGHRQSWLRRICLDTIEREFALDLDQRYEPSEYAQKLLHTRLGLNFFGFGFDTVRYWELPAHEVLLFSERPPIRIPFDFEDARHAVFYASLPELLEKLRYYRDHPEEGAAIARAGRAHLLKHHTSTARARQLLGRIFNALGA